MQQLEIENRRRDSPIGERPPRRPAEKARGFLGRAATVRRQAEDGNFAEVILRSGR
jgi:hypothetical protein